MQTGYLVVLLSWFGFTSVLLGENTVRAVLDYRSGIGFAHGYTNIASVIGIPSRVTEGPFGGPVDPFNGPYLPTQLLSIGEGGSLILQLNEPFYDHQDNSFGIDFSIFGNSFFVITNGNYVGGGITDGSVYPDSPGVTRVSVSGDGATFFELTPSLAPGLVTYYPTDGSGRFDQVVNPNLRAADFAGKDIDGIRALYAGSAGGTGFDLAWARNHLGEVIPVGGVSFIRIEVLSGHVEIGGITAVPEPTSVSLISLFGFLAFVGVRKTRSRTVA